MKILEKKICDYCGKVTNEEFEFFNININSNVERIIDGLHCTVGLNISENDICTNCKSEITAEFENVYQTIKSDLTLQKAKNNKLKNIILAPINKQIEEVFRGE